MKYQVITYTIGTVRTNAIAKIGDDLNNFEVVAETKTKKEAEEIIKNLGGWITLA